MSEHQRKVFVFIYMAKKLGEAQQFFRDLQGGIGKYHKDLKKFAKGKSKSKALSKLRK